MADRQLKVTIVGDTKSLDRALGRTETRLSRFGRSVGGTRGGKVGSALSGSGLGGIGKAGVIGAGIAVGSAVAIKSLKSVIAAAKEAEVAQANLAQAFEASGTSTVKFSRQVDAAIQKTSKLSGIDDELVSGAFANLLRTTGSVGKATRDVALAANIARARNISLAAAAKVVEKAENGQLRGLKALGVQIDKGTTSTEAIEAAQRKFAGSAERYGRTAAGAQDRLSVAFENLQERVGEKLLPVLTKLSLKLIELIDWSEKNWPKFAKAVGDAYKAAKPFIDQTIGIIKGIGDSVAGVVRIVHGVFTGDWSEAWRGAKQIAVKGVAEIGKAMATLPLVIARSLGKAAFSGIESLFAAALNRIIGLINKAIGAYNKIPLVPDISKIPTFGGSGSGGGPKVAPRSPVTPRGAASPGGRNEPRTTASTTVNLVVDGRVLAQTVIPEIRKQSKTSSGQSRGRMYPHTV